MKKVPLITSRYFKDRFRSWKVGGKRMKIFNGITEVDEEALSGNFAFLHTSNVVTSGNRDDIRHVLHVVDKTHGQTYRFIKYNSRNTVKVAMPGDPEIVETSVGEFVKFLQCLTYIPTPVAKKAGKQKLEESAPKTN